MDVLGDMPRLQRYIQHGSVTVFFTRQLERAADDYDSLSLIGDCLVSERTKNLNYLDFRRRELNHSVLSKIHIIDARLMLFGRTQEDQ